MDIFYIVIAGIIILILIAVVVAAVLRNQPSTSNTGNNGNGTGQQNQPVQSTPLGDLHVCVTQINNFLQSLPTDRKSFCAALKAGIPSQCSTLVLQAVDENGDDLITFKWSNGKFIGDFGDDCKLTGTDIIMFKVLDKMNCSNCTCDLNTPCSNYGVCINKQCYASGDYTVSQIMLSN